MREERRTKKTEEEVLRYAILDFPLSPVFPRLTALLVRVDVLVHARATSIDVGPMSNVTTGQCAGLIGACVAGPSGVTYACVRTG